VPRTSHRAVERWRPSRWLHVPRKFSGGRLAISAAIAFIIGALTPTLWAQDSKASEYRSKAHFLATFPSFVEWPEVAFPSGEAPFLICVRGDFSFGTSLAELARGASPHGKRVEVRWVHNDQELRNCHIAFISRSESKRYAKLLQVLEGAGVLTVGETQGFLECGGAISFSFEREALQFEVNLVAADSAHLKINSRLLTLARRVVNRTGAAKG
jgi:hypothetical protein